MATGRRWSSRPGTCAGGTPRPAGRTWAPSGPSARPRWPPRGPATGIAWRRLAVPRLEALVGSGVFYGAAGTEAQAMEGRDVFVVGAGNSGGQTALHLARYARRVTMLVRGTSLARSMSDYL